MALETDVPVVGVPRSVIFEFFGPIAVQTGVGSSDTVGIPVTPRPRASRVGLVVAGGATFKIAARRFAMPAYPPDSGMFERHAALRLMTIVAEGSGVVAGLTVQPFRFGVKPMRVLIIQIVNFSGQIVAAMTGQTTVLILVAGLTPLGPVGRFVGVLETPVGWMDVGQRDFALVTETALVGRCSSVVAVHAGPH
jgi:hypothetical protein